MSKPISNHFQSEIVTIVLKDSLAKPFYVHKTLLGAASSELHKHVFNDMREGLGNKLELEDVEEITMKHVLAWLYTQSYQDKNRYHNPKLQLRPQLLSKVVANPKGRWAAASQLRKEPETVDQTVTLLEHAKVHVFADRFNLPELKSLTIGYVTSILRSCGNSPDGKMREDIAATLVYCLHNLPTVDLKSTGGAPSLHEASSSPLFPSVAADSVKLTSSPMNLLSCLGEYITWTLNTFRADDVVFTTLLQEPDFAKLLLYRLPSATKPTWINENSLDFLESL